MKLKLPLLVLSLLFALDVSAQISHHCGSAEYLSHLNQQNPGLEQYVKNLAKLYENHGKNRSTVITVPVVVHVVYNNATENLTDDYINAQIDLLNKCYLRKNADTTNLRSEFVPIAGRANIQFMLVQTIRKSTSKTRFLVKYDNWNNNFADSVKSDATGGSSPVTPDSKLNIWICDLDDTYANSDILGYAYPPAGLPNWGGGGQASGSPLDGVVLDYMVVGGTLKLPKGNITYGAGGKTAVHEIGHYLGLRHTWGDDGGACQGGQFYEDDGVADTPVQGDYSNGCDKVINSCNQGAGDLKDMVENFMDYSSESCQNSFTKGQVSLMEGVLANQRINIRVPLAVNDIDISSNILVFPNPSATGSINIGVINIDYAKAEITLTNSVGQVVKTHTMSNNNTKTVLSVSDLPKGIYFVKTILDGDKSNVQKVIVQ